MAALSLTGIDFSSLGAQAPRSREIISAEKVGGWVMCTSVCVFVEWRGGWGGGGCAAGTRLGKLAFDSASRSQPPAARSGRAGPGQRWAGPGRGSGGEPCWDHLPASDKHGTG